MQPMQTMYSLSRCLAVSPSRPLAVSPSRRPAVSLSRPFALSFCPLARSPSHANAAAAAVFRAARVRNVERVAAARTLCETDACRHAEEHVVWDRRVGAVHGVVEGLGQSSRSRRGHRRRRLTPSARSACFYQ
ncbi:hypothetical protein DFH11DRAFT_1732812 [Phellopilus nigrolimitatus]|nr:hypothetical protein DFH11DRAFT_1732812 [Phellopilus nigrolimitatus]